MIRQGQCFSYALPPDWQVAEDGAFALTLMAPDLKATPTYPFNPSRVSISLAARI